MTDDILVYSDIHFHRWTRFSEPSLRVNTRVDRIVDSVSWVAGQIIKLRPSLVVMAGDLIHNVKSADFEVYNQAYLSVKEIDDACEEVGAEQVLVSGNHDRLGRSDRGGVCLLPLDELPNTVLFDGEIIYGVIRFVPYTKSQISSTDVPLTICHTDILENTI